MIEEWIDIAGYEGWYQVSNLGRIKSLKREMVSHGHKKVVNVERILKPSLHGKSKNYEYVRLKRNNTTQNCEVHRLVASHFIREPHKGEQVDHIDRNTTNNNVSNLRWVTQSENMYNRNDNHLIEYQGEVLPLGMWAQRLGMRYSVLSSRVLKKWSIEKAFTTPVIAVNKRRKES